MIGRTNANAGGGLNKSVIVVTAPAGSTVTCKSGSTTKTATEKSGTWTFSGLDNGTWTVTAALSGQTATKSVTISKLTVEYVTMSYRVTPEFTYTGTYEIVDDNDNAISNFATWTGNWKIRFLTSGTFQITNMHGFAGSIDVFLAGGGGSGTSGVWVNGYVQTERIGGGGGSGYTKNIFGKAVSVGTEYAITIGAGGSAMVGATGNAGGATTAFGATANGGDGGGHKQSTTARTGSSGGNGGSGGASENGTGGRNGANGGGDNSEAGTGQGTPTHEFNSASGKVEPAGGDSTSATGASGGANTGDGGGGGAYANTSNETKPSGGSGGSGIVIIRNKR